MADGLAPTSTQHHYAQALAYEHKANTGVGDSAVNAQLAVMHATLAAAATNLALLETQNSNAGAQRERLAGIEEGVATIAKTVPSKLNDVSDSIAEVAGRMAPR
ncbi:hypothetical protein GS489_01180 [Rhodococcus hoagii]|nr:hypothetical protein [Prescottella equi]